MFGGLRPIFKFVFDTCRVTAHLCLKIWPTAVAKWLTFSRATFNLKSTVTQLSRSYISINLSRIAVGKGANFSERVHKEIWLLKERSFLIGWDMGVQTLVQKRLLNVLWQSTSHRDDHVFLNLWTSVAVAREMLASRCKQIIGGYPKEGFEWRGLKLK